MTRKKKRENKPGITLSQSIRSQTYSKAFLKGSVPVELDLESREIFINEAALENSPLKLNCSSLDQFINRYVSPSQKERIVESLDEAGKGVEKPISFSFVHPDLKRELQFEYHYQIVYVSYSKTRLNGKLIKRKG